MKTSEILRKYRTSRGLSQMELELAINASNGTISRIENGKINPTKETLLKIADYLKLSFIETAQLLGLKPRLDSLTVKKSIKNYLESLPLLFGNTNNFDINEFSYSEGEKTFIDKCTQTLYKSSKEVLFIGNHDIFRKYYPEKIDKELYIAPRVKNHLPAKIIACNENTTLSVNNEQDYLREVKRVENFKVNLMANINDTSVVLMCLNNAPSILEIFDKNLVELAKKRFYQMWGS